MKCAMLIPTGNAFTCVSLKPLKMTELHAPSTMIDWECMLVLQHTWSLAAAVLPAACARHACGPLNVKQNPYCGKQSPTVSRSSRHSYKHCRRSKKAGTSWLGVAVYEARIGLVPF